MNTLYVNKEQCQEMRYLATQLPREADGRYRFSTAMVLITLAIAVLNGHHLILAPDTYGECSYCVYADPQFPNSRIVLRRQIVTLLGASSMSQWVIDFVEGVIIQ